MVTKESAEIVEDITQNIKKLPEQDKYFLAGYITARVNEQEETKKEERKDA